MRQSFARLSLALALVLASPLAALAQDAFAATAQADVAAAAQPSRWQRMHASMRSQHAHTQLLTSVISSVGFGPELLWGAGLQLRLDHTPGGELYRVGGFFQSEVLTDGAVRVAGGLQGGMWMMGMQVGLAYRFESDRYWSTLGLQLGKSIDLGIFQIGGRIVIPLVDFTGSGGQSPAMLTSTGIEGAVFVSVGLPTTLEGERRSCGCPHRRGGAQPQSEDAQPE
ncbi:MAG: hypothetical protein OHK0013_31930 [Sandaracinaceae bacterium]